MYMLCVYVFIFLNIGLYNQSCGRSSLVLGVSTGPLVQHIAGSCTTQSKILCRPRWPEVYQDLITIFNGIKWFTFNFEFPEPLRLFGARELWRCLPLICLNSFFNFSRELKTSPDMFRLLGAPQQRHPQWHVGFPGPFSHAKISCGGCPSEIAEGTRGAWPATAVCI